MRMTRGYTTDEILVAEELETTDPPTEERLEILRYLEARTEASSKKTRGGARKPENRDPTRGET